MPVEIVIDSELVLLLGVYEISGVKLMDYFREIRHEVVVLGVVLFYFRHQPFDLDIHLLIHSLI